MLIPDLPSLLTFLNNDHCHQICIIDNNLLEKLVSVKEKIECINVFGRYDLLLIPEWVYIEICDGEGRKQYVEELFKSDFIKCYIIAEKDYSELCGYKELELYFIVLNCCKEMGQLYSFIRKNILDPKLVDTDVVDEMKAYEEWVVEMYMSQEAFPHETLKNGRIKRKNAGEISICILAAVLSVYFDKLEGITIFSFDQDTYKIMNKYKEGIAKEIRFDRYIHKPITFKTNNSLLQEWVSEGYIEIDNIMTLTACMRGKQNVKYTRMLQDGSIEEQYKVLGNEEFIELLSGNVHIIY